MPLTHQVALCVFCGSSLGAETYVKATRELASGLARENVSVVYGGGNIGLMGILADTMLDSGGRVTGVIPQFLIDLEVARHGLTELIVVNSMHERKAMMADRSDAFVALPGGFGTMEEFFEVLTWLQLGLHKKPCILLNVNNFYTPLLNFLHSASESGYISAHSMQLITVCNSIDELMAIVKSLAHTDGFREDRT